MVRHNISAGAGSPGKVLHSLDRRSEATILAWNFFTDFTPDDRWRPGLLHPAHIDTILEQLQTPYVDCLVMVPSDHTEQNQQQQELLLDWQRRGYVRSLGLWISDPAIIEGYRSGNPFDTRSDLQHRDSRGPAVFAACKLAGWRRSPRRHSSGMELDRIVAEATACALARSRRYDRCSRI